MFRTKLSVAITGIVCLVASSAFGATATFTPVSPTTVFAGNDVVFTVTVASASGFDAGDIVIGSDDATDLEFIYDTAWTSAFSNVSPLVFDPGFYAQAVFAGGNNPSSVGTSLVLGTLTVKTTGMLGGTYAVGIDNAVDGFSKLSLSSIADPLSGTAAFTVVACTLDTECDDAMFCNGAETCVSGSCTPGIALDCSGSSDQCNVGTCNEVTEVCEQAPSNEGLGCDDSQFCTTGETCTAGACGGGSATDCSVLSDQCNTGTCNETLNLCEALAMPDSTTCNDADPCTEGDVCTSGTCAGVNVPRITITLEVEALAPAVSVARDVTSVMTACAGPTTNTRVVQATFDPSGVGTVILENVDPLATWINVREAHALSRVRSLTFAACNQATITLTGVDRLTTGDLNGDGLVDIEDFSVLASLWNTAGDQADLNGDGQQNNTDLTLLIGNILMTGDALDGCVP